MSKPLIEELFSSGVMQMGPSRNDPERQVGVFNPVRIAGLPALRAAEMKKWSWIPGEWTSENRVPETAVSPAFTDIGKAHYDFDSKGEWLCMVAPDGTQFPNITFDPFSRQWIYVLTRGAYGLLRSAEGWQADSISFTGLMTMLGPTREWRMRWTREGDDAFGFVNEEVGPDGEWIFVDEWSFRRKK